MVETESSLYCLPRSEYERLSALLLSRRGGWVTVTDVFGADRMFRMRDILDVSDWSPQSLELVRTAEIEDRLDDPGE